VRFGNLREIVDGFIRDGQTIAMEGFTHLIPFAAAHEIIRQGRRDLHLIRMTPDLIYDQMIGIGCARALTFSWGGNPGVGSLYRLRDAVEHDWPGPLEIHEHSHAGMAAAYTAGAARLPFGVLRGYAGTDLPGVNAQLVMGGGLGSDPFGIHCLLCPGNHKIVDSILYIRTTVPCSKNSLKVGFVICEQELWAPGAYEPSLSYLKVANPNRGRSLAYHVSGQLRNTSVQPPRPGVAKPNGGQDVDAGGIGASIEHCDSDENIFGCCFCIFHDDVEVAILLEYPGIE